MTGAISVHGVDCAVVEHPIDVGIIFPDAGEPMDVVHSHAVVVRPDTGELVIVAHTPNNSAPWSVSLQQPEFHRHEYELRRLAWVVASAYEPCVRGPR